MKAIKIPDAWLMGATTSRIVHGMAPKEALEDAIRGWLEQEELAAQYEEEQCQIKSC